MCPWNVRTLETHPKAILWKVDIEFYVVMGRSSVASRFTQLGSQPNVILLPVYSCGSFTQ